MINKLILNYNIILFSYFLETQLKNKILYNNLNQ